MAIFLIFLSRFIKFILFNYVPYYTLFDIKSQYKEKTAGSHISAFAGGSSSSLRDEAFQEGGVRA